MGREVRRVPPNWEHPKAEHGRDAGDYQPMRDRDAEEAWADWQKEYAEWLAGEHARIAEKYGADSYPLDQPYRSFCAWHGQPPDPDYYRPRWPDGSATWFQLYETVSEGTPVTPPFATREELVEYLVAHGDFWDQKRRAEGRTSMPCGPWGRAAAEGMVKAGSAPSMIVTRTAAGVEVKMPRDGQE